MFLEAIQEFIEFLLFLFQVLPLLLSGDFSALGL